MAGEKFKEEELQYIDETKLRRELVFRGASWAALASQSEETVKAEIEGQKPMGHIEAKRGQRTVDLAGH